MDRCAERRLVMRGIPVSEIYRDINSDGIIYRYSLDTAIYRLTVLTVSALFPQSIIWLYAYMHTLCSSFLDYWSVSNRPLA